MHRCGRHPAGSARHSRPLEVAGQPYLPICHCPFHAAWCSRGCKPIADLIPFTSSFWNSGDPAKKFAPPGWFASARESSPVSERSI